jgi:hypothetical protein
MKEFNRSAPTRTRFAVVAAASVFLALPSQGQEISSPSVSKAVSPKLSVNNEVRSLAPARPRKRWLPGDPIQVKEDLERGSENAVSVQVGKTPDALLPRRGQLVPAPAPVRTTPTLGASFDGIGSTGVLPPDTVGAVGPFHFIQMVNSEFAIYDKKGLLLFGPSPINSLWKGFGGPCETDNDGDPLVRYDSLAKRWLVSQFAVDKYTQCIAISRDSDPVSGGWYLYAFDTTDENGQYVTPDYPKIGVWPDGYYMSTQRGFPDEGMDVWVFERDQMLQGYPARQVHFSIMGKSVVLQPADSDGPAPLGGTASFFVRQMDGERFGGDDRVEIYALKTDWKSPTESRFTKEASIKVAPFDSMLCSDDLLSACVSQPKTDVKLEALSAWPMFRAHFRQFDGHASMLLNHTVDATGTDMAGIRWYELRRSADAAWLLHQQGIVPPDSAHRWMGSLAMDGAGNIAIGYSVSGDKVYPGIRVAGRTGTDPQGRFGKEVIVVEGGGSQTYAPAPRWGDYASMDVDPAQNNTFWFTTLYYKSTSDAGWSTRIVEIRVPSQ